MTPAHPDEPLWTVTEVAHCLTMSKQWVYKQAELGILPCIRLGASLRFQPAEIRAYLDRLRAPNRVLRLSKCTQEP